MMPRLSRQRWIWPAVLLSLLAIVAIHAAQAQGTTVRLETPRDSPEAGGEPFDVTVVVDDVTNLGAFEFRSPTTRTSLSSKTSRKAPFWAAAAVPCNACRPAGPKETLISPA